MPDETFPDEIEQIQALKNTPEIFARIAELSGTELQIQKQLRAEFPTHLVPAALLLCELRDRAKAKFSRAERMWFDRQGLEQSTSEQVAAHKARRFTGRVFDLCAGIGGDAIALAERGNVVAFDKNPATCLRAKWNAEEYAVAHRIEFRTDDVETWWKNEGTSADVVHIDPDRRARNRGRSLRIEEGQPGLSFLRELMTAARGGAIKLSPAANFLGKFPDAEIELVSLSGECKEATVWFGELANPGEFRATVLPEGESIAGDPLDALSEIHTPGRFLFDPNPAVVRAGLIDLLAERENVWRLDDSDEYLSADAPLQSPFFQGFEVLEELPNNDKTLRAYFRSADFGSVEIKCRHVPVQAETVRRKLALDGQANGVVIYAKVSGKSRVFVCRRLSDMPLREKNP